MRTAMAAAAVLMLAGCGGARVPASPSAPGHPGATGGAGSSIHPSAAGARFAELSGTYHAQTGLSLPPRADALARKICSPENLAAARISYRLSDQAVRKGNPSKAAYFIVDAIDTYCPGIKGR